MKIKIMKNDIGCCASDCEFKNDNWCNLFLVDLIGDKNNPTRHYACYWMTNTDAEFSSIRFEIDKSNKCFGCENYRKEWFNNCTAGILCKDGNLNKYRVKLANSK
jgi:hypothetical protein